MFNETPQIEPIKAGLKLRILSDEQLDQFKSATFEILEETGIHCPWDRASACFKQLTCASWPVVCKHLRDCSGRLHAQDEGARGSW